MSSTSSPITSADIFEKLSSAGSRREEVLQLRKENIDQKLAMVQSKKDEIANEKATKTKEVTRMIFKELCLKVYFPCRSWRPS